MSFIRSFSKQSSFDQVYNLYWKGLFVFAQNILHNKENAEDIVQEVFVDLWIRKDSLDVNNCQSYLFKAVRNQCAKRLKSKVLLPLEIALLEEAINSVEAEEQLPISPDELFTHVQNKAQEILPEKCLDVFEMRFYEKLSVQDIADRKNISVSTVENHINKALKLLRSENLYYIKLVAFIILRNHD